MKKKKSVVNAVLIVLLSVICLAYVYPVFMILMNSLKDERANTTSSAFHLPTPDTFAGLENYVKAIVSQGFLKSLGFSLFITVVSVALILVCCSMCAWYITRISGPVSRVLYFLFVLSMVVPFRMACFSLFSCRS